MDKTAIKNFAIQARKDLIAGVKQKAYEYGIDEKTTGNEAPTGALLNGRILGSEEQSQRSELLKLIKTKGYDQVMEEVAYTWFNRFIALRFMEVNEYLPSRIRVFTNEHNEFKPEILSEALHLELDGLNKAKVISFLEMNQTEEMYKYLLITQCNDLNAALPEMFEKIQNYTELLFPNNLLKEGSVLSCMISNISQDDWTEAVEIIGWLYQYYNTDVKDETFALLKKNVKITKERIPSATQLFTPDWIVRYMVENSLGRLWIEGHPSDSLKSNWKYYLDEAEQEPEAVEKLEKIRAGYAKIKLEEIKVIDPCMGSGHILVYAFDVLMQIYIDTGYSERDAVTSILQNNLFGLDIDDRAYQLSYFAVMMKARKYCRTIFSVSIHPNLYSIQESNFVTPELIQYVSNGDAKIKYDLQAVVESLHDAKEYGSIIKTPNVNYEKIISQLYNILVYIDSDLNGIYLKQIVISLLIPLIHQAQMMNWKYDVVITNPPYMSSNGMKPNLSDYVKKEYPNSKSDLFAVFIEHCFEMTNNERFNAMITMQSWMFLSSFEILRKAIIENFTVANLIQIGYNSFPELNSKIAQAVSFVTLKIDIPKYMGKYLDLSSKYSQSYDKEIAFHIEKRKGAYCAKTDDFAKIPGVPFAYWVSENIYNAFSNGTNITKYIDTFQGIITGDNDKFLRLWFEPNIKTLALNKSSMEEIDIKFQYWIPYNKGGDFRSWYGNQEYVVNWKNGPDDKTRGKKSFQNYYLREYVSWSYITTSTLACRYFPKGFLWDVAGSGIFDKSNMLYYLQSLIGSKVGAKLLNIINPTINFQVENIAQLPILIENKELVDSLVQANISLSMADWNNYETSWNFARHPFLSFKDNVKLKDIYEKWDRLSSERFLILKKNQEELNRIFICIYNLCDELTPEVEEKDVTISLSDLGRDIRSLISFVVGVNFGRYSMEVEGLAYAGGDWDDNKYKTIIPDKDNILPISDDVYFDDDIVSKVVDFVKVVYGEETLEENLQFIADSLGNRGDSSRDVIRNYFLNDFYKDHLKIYQKRPIYWLFDSGKKNGFKALIYMHRYKPNLMATMRTDYVHEQQERYRTQLQHLDASIQHANTADQAKINKQIGNLKEQSLELLAYEEKIHHLADQMIDIDLDDGVKVNYAKFEDVLAPIK